MNIEETIQEIIKDYPTQKIGLDDFYGRQTVVNMLNEAINYSLCCKSDSELLSCDEKCEWEHEHTNWFKCKVCGMVEARAT